jgi:hypothetical protein
MSKYQPHLYLILFPNEALVASQLTPEEFGKHYAIGSPRHFNGKVIFMEVNIDYRHEYLRLEDILKNLEASNLGRPKRTRFVKSYRVLEHIDFSAFKKLYLVTTDGGVLGLDQSTQPAAYEDKGSIRLYQEICPLRVLVASSMDPDQFGDYITEGTWSKGAPKIFFTQYDIDVEECVISNPIHALNMGPLPNVNPTNLPTAYQELKEDPSKKTKTVSLNPNLDLMSYKSIRHGFWFSDGSTTIFYRMPTFEELHENYRSWWRHL